MNQQSKDGHKFYGIEKDNDRAFEKKGVIKQKKIVKQSLRKGKLFFLYI